MSKKTGLLAKLSRPRLHGAYARRRLFALLDERRRCPVLWIAGPPGAGKTTLAASYLDAQDVPGLWYQLDSGDGDPASFVYYLRQAAAGLGGRKRAPLPLLTPEYLADLPGFARRWWQELFGRLRDRAVLVLDNYRDLPAESAGGHEVAGAAMCAALWPDSEADAADHALGITLQRLRKILGDERAVIQQGGKLSLDARHCWVDAWAFDALLDRAEALLRSERNADEVEQMAARICEANRGVFLANEPGQPWTLRLRGRLRANDALGALARAAAGAGGRNGSSRRALSTRPGAGQSDRGALPAVNGMSCEARLTGGGHGSLPPLPGTALHCARHPAQCENGTALPSDPVSLKSFRTARVRPR